METTFTNKAAIVKTLKTQLSTNQSQIEKGIIRIYQYQTSEEQKAGDVRNYNLVGFRACDAYILTSFAKWLLTEHHLTEKQLVVAKRLMPAYAGQLVNQSIRKGLIVKEGKFYSFKK